MVAPSGRISNFFIADLARFEDLKLECDHYNFPAKLFSRKILVEKNFDGIMGSDS